MSVRRIVLFRRALRFEIISSKSAIKMQVVTIICYTLASLLHILEKKGNEY